MALVGKLVGQITIISDGDVFHDLFTNKPHHVSNITPSLVKGCDLHDGQWGKVGSIVIWSYVHGKLFHITHVHRIHVHACTYI